MSTEMPVPSRRGRPTGWASKPAARTGSSDASPTTAPPAAPPTTPATPTRTTAPAGARPELSRHITLRLRSTTEEHLEEILAPLAGGRVDRTELIHALIEAADAESAKAAVLARRRRQTEFD
jgi:hypothetical protein